jgi:hypothetical protein
MSVDSRLRQARPEDDARWEAGLDLALEGVLRNARRRRTRHAAVAAGAVAAVLAVGGLSIGLANDDGPRPAPAVPSPTTTPTPAVAGSGPMDGVWRTPKLDRQDVAAALERAGISSTVADEFVTTLPTGTFRYRMSISRGILQARVNHEEPPAFIQFLSVKGGSLTMSPTSAGYGQWTYSYNIDGDRLALNLRRTTVPDYDGFSSRVHGVAMFGVAPFIHAG